LIARKAATEKKKITIFLSEANPDFYSQLLHSSNAASQSKAARSCTVFISTSIAFFVAILASKKAKGVLHSQAHDNHRVVLIYSVVLSTKGEAYNLGGLKGPPRMLTATFVSSSCLLTSAQGGWMIGMGGIGRGSLQLGRGEVEVGEEEEAGEEQNELAIPSPSQPW